MRKEYIKPAIDMAVIASEQTLLVGTNMNNWAEAKENSFEEEEKTDYLSDIQFKDIWEDEEE